MPGTAPIARVTAGLPTGAPGETAAPEDAPGPGEETHDDGGPAAEESTAEEAAAAQQGRRTGWIGRLGRWSAVLLLAVAAVLPAAVALVDLLRGRGRPYLPIGDQALLELTIHDMDRHEVLLGAYSRFLWHHPGPMIAQILSVPYRLMDGAHESLAVGAAAVAGISSLAAVLLVARRAGLLAGVWTLLVLTLTVRLLGTDFLRDSWNPHLPVLPLLAGVLLCWAVVRGSAWALPVAVVPLSLAVQAHVGFLGVVGAVGAVVGVGLVVRAVRLLLARRSGQPRRRLWWLRWPVAVVAAAGVGVLLWLPPIREQLDGRPGNMTLLWEYLRDGSAEPSSLSVGTALRVVADEFGKLPAYVAGAARPQASLLPELWPPWAIAVGIGLFVVALLVGVLRRRGDVVWLGVLTLAVAAAGVVSVARVEGLPFTYITRWTVVVGILAWLTVGVSLLPELVAGVRRVVGRDRPALLSGALVGLPLAVVAAVVVGTTAVDSAGAETPFTDTTGETARLEAAVIGDLERLGLRTVPDPPVVRVDFSGTTHPVVVGTFWPGTGLVLQLVRDGVDVQVSDFWQVQFGSRYTDRADDAGYVVTVAYADGSSPPPEPWQQVLAVEGEFQVYGGIPPAA